MLPALPVTQHLVPFMLIIGKAICSDSQSILKLAYRLGPGLRSMLNTSLRERFF